MCEYLPTSDFRKRLASPRDLLLPCASKNKTDTYPYPIIIIKEKNVYSLLGMVTVTPGVLIMRLTII